MKNLGLGLILYWLGAISGREQDFFLISLFIPIMGLFLIVIDEVLDYKEQNKKVEK